jgi:hypothetical protein
MKALLGLAIGMMAMAQAVQADKAAQAASSQAASAPAGTERPTAAATPGQASFDRLKTLFGRWEAPLGNGKTIVDTFQPFAAGAAILGEEWVDGEQITSTVFYMVGAELRADHYCDYGNQPRYVAQPSDDPNTIDLAMRDVTNLDTHPRHFHATTWHLVDAAHMTQEWDVEGGPKASGSVHLEFVRRDSAEF